MEQNVSSPVAGLDAPWGVRHLTRLALFLTVLLLLPACGNSDGAATSGNEAVMELQTLMPEVSTALQDYINYESSTSGLFSSGSWADSVRQGEKLAPTLDAKLAHIGGLLSSIRPLIDEVIANDRVPEIVAGTASASDLQKYFGLMQQWVANQREQNTMSLACIRLALRIARPCLVNMLQTVGQRGIGIANQVNQLHTTLFASS